MQSIINSSSKQDERQLLLDCQNRQDILAAFFRIIIIYLPSVYIFVNITLVIWIAQTVFNSQISPIPNSLYLLSPLLVASPINQLIIQSSVTKCPKDYSPLVLKRIPTIYPNIVTERSQLTIWGQESIQFCAKQLDSSLKNDSCTKKDTIRCSGYCVKNQDDCPITKLSITTTNSSTNNTLTEYATIYNQSGKQYLISKAEGTPIVDLMVSYSTKCANDEYYNDFFDNETMYWSVVQNCSNQGTIDVFVRQIDEMPTNTFFKNNQIDITVTNSSISTVNLGLINQFTIPVENQEKCPNQHANATTLKSFLAESPSQVNFNEILLLTCFIFLIANIIWLIVYHCCGEYYKIKNNIVVIFAIIQVTVVGIFYHQNNRLSEVGQITTSLFSCLSLSFPRLLNEHFGIDSTESFQMILFLNTVFLGLYLSSLLLDFLFYQDYKRAEVFLPRNQSQHEHQL